MIYFGTNSVSKSKTWIIDFANQAISKESVAKVREESQLIEQPCSQKAFDIDTKRFDKLYY